MIAKRSFNSNGESKITNITYMFQRMQVHFSGGITMEIVAVLKIMPALLYLWKQEEHQKR